MSISIKTKVRVRVNGKEYGSLEEAPPEIREVYEKSTGLRVGSGRITINGKSYDSIDELPPELRSRYEELMSMALDGTSVKHRRPGASLRFGMAPSIEDEHGAVDFTTTTSSTKAFLIVVGVLVLIGSLFFAS